MLELYKQWEFMAAKKYIDENGAAKATALRQTAGYDGTGMVIGADSWFRLLKTAIVLTKIGLYYKILVKTADNGFPKELLNKNNNSSGEWVAYIADVKSVKGSDKQCLNEKCNRKLNPHGFLGVCFELGVEGSKTR